MLAEAADARASVAGSRDPDASARWESEASHEDGGYKLMRGTDAEYAVAVVADGNAAAIVHDLRGQVGRSVRVHVVQTRDLLSAAGGGPAADVVIAEDGAVPVGVLVAQALRMWRGARILVLGRGPVGSVVTAARAGAVGYVCRDVAQSDLGEALCQALAGVEFVLPRCLRPDGRCALLGQCGHGARTHNSPGNYHALTPRQREVLAQLKRGLTNAEIGQVLFISEQTVKEHVSSILHKLRLRGRAQLLAPTHAAESDAAG
jgi:DNA-binding NarL/FixJ family response regulator